MLWEPNVSIHACLLAAHVVCQQGHIPYVPDCAAPFQLLSKLVGLQKPKDCGWESQILTEQGNKQTICEIAEGIFFHTQYSWKGFKALAVKLNTRHTFLVPDLESTAYHNDALCHCVSFSSPMSWPMRWRSVTSCSPACSLWRCCWRCWSTGPLATSRTPTISLMASLWSSGELHRCG